MVPLKVSIFAWRLGLNHLPSKDNLFKRRVLTEVEQGCSANCGLTEDRDHLFFQCDFYCKIWQLTGSWLGVSIAFHGNLMSHLTQFGGLGEFSTKVKYSLHIIWIAVVWVTWKERNHRIFQNKQENIRALCERVRLLSLWWLKSKYITFNYDY